MQSICFTPKFIVIGYSLRDQSGKVAGLLDKVRKRVRLNKHPRVPP